MMMIAQSVVMDDAIDLKALAVLASRIRFHREERAREAKSSFGLSTSFGEAIANAIEWTGGALVVGSPAAFEHAWLRLEFVPIFHELMDRGELELLETSFVEGDALRVLPRVNVDPFFGLKPRIELEREAEP
jgi:hypothetical protein